MIHMSNLHQLFFTSEWERESESESKSKSPIPILIPKNIYTAVFRYDSKNDRTDPDTIPIPKKANFAHP